VKIIILEAPCETAGYFTDEDTDISDSDITGNPNLLPRAVLRAPTKLQCSEGTHSSAVSTPSTSKEMPKKQRVTKKQKSVEK